MAYNFRNTDVLMQAMVYEIKYYDSEPNHDYNDLKLCSFDENVRDLISLLFYENNTSRQLREWKPKL